MGGGGGWLWLWRGRAYLCGSSQALCFTCPAVSIFNAGMDEGGSASGVQIGCSQADYGPQGGFAGSGVSWESPEMCSLNSGFSSSTTIARQKQGKSLDSQPFSGSRIPMGPTRLRGPWCQLCDASCDQAQKYHGIATPGESNGSTSELHVARDEHFRPSR